VTWFIGSNAFDQHNRASARPRGPRNERDVSNAEHLASGTSAEARRGGVLAVRRRAQFHGRCLTRCGSDRQRPPIPSVTSVSHRRVWFRNRHGFVAVLVFYGGRQVLGELLDQETECSSSFREVTDNLRLRNRAGWPERPASDWACCDRSPRTLQLCEPRANRDDGQRSAV
jgi:hypothetical protein